MLPPTSEAALAGPQERSSAMQREVENSPVPLSTASRGAASPGPLMLGTSLQVMLRSAAPHIWISPSPDRGKVQLRCTLCVLLCATTAARTPQEQLPIRVGDVSFST